MTAKSDFFVTRDRFQTNSDVEAILQTYKDGGMKFLAIQYEYQVIGDHFVITTWEKPCDR